MRHTSKPRPALLRALGKQDPPLEIMIDGACFARAEIYKHDSWAATARYEGAGRSVVCKFNRVQPIFGVPTSWLGRRLARREALALCRLAGLPGVAPACGPIFSGGRWLENAMGHEFIAAHPLARKERPGDDFFPALLALLREMHRRNLAYVDLHKRENILVGDDGLPYLIDFQVSFGLWNERMARSGLAQAALRNLIQADLYHLSKHIQHHRPDQAWLLGETGRRPAWIELHRMFAVHLRQLRRSVLVSLGVRGKKGRATSEVFAEAAVRQELDQAA
ncbi:MAG: hypothetical protein FJ271_08860 [Planctomycetes bacterium]|nr:hypothetical protein [Planctomycetota bacterium]